MGAQGGGMPSCLVQGHVGGGTHPEAVGRGVQVPGLWSLVDVDSNPSSGAYQRGAPGRLRAPRPPHQWNRTTEHRAQGQHEDQIQQCPWRSFVGSSSYCT